MPDNASDKSDQIQKSEFDERLSKIREKASKPDRQDQSPDFHPLAYAFLLIDCSGSMSGAKLSDAKTGAIEFARDAFDKRYAVGVISFASSAFVVCESSTDVSAVQEQISEMRASGGTNMSSALELAYEESVYSYDNVVVLVTDGQPNNKRATIRKANKLKSEDIDIITIGTDDADYKFLNRLASKENLSKRVDKDNLESGIKSASRLLPS